MPAHRLPAGFAHKFALGYIDGARTDGVDVPHHVRDKEFVALQREATQFIAKRYKDLAIIGDTEYAFALGGMLWVARSGRGNFVYWGNDKHIAAAYSRCDQMAYKLGPSKVK